MLNISLGASQAFNIPLVKILCLVLYPVFNRVILFSASGWEWLLFKQYLWVFSSILKIVAKYGVGCMYIHLHIGQLSLPWVQMKSTNIIQFSGCG